jgi:hypothetical protein
MTVLEIKHSQSSDVGGRNIAEELWSYLEAFLRRARNRAIISYEARGKHDVNPLCGIYAVSRLRHGM